MNNDDVILTRDEALDVLAAVEATKVVLRNTTVHLGLLLDLTEAAEILTDKLF